MTKPILVMSDIHFHDWSAFAGVDEDGVNSRLKEIIEAMDRALTTLHHAGGHRVFIAGDVFHKRGSVAPAVLNPVMDAFAKAVKEGFEFHVIPGNHDMTANDSQRAGNAVTALESVGVNVYHDVALIEDPDDLKAATVMFPWFSTVSDLIEAMTKAHAQYKGTYKRLRAIIHAPVDGVLPHLPSHGVDGNALASIGYTQVLSGHYHNHCQVAEGVYSIGALTHQSWGDIGSKAGYLLIDQDWSVKHFETEHPQFVEITGDEDPADLPFLLMDSYVRFRALVEDDSDLDEIREGLMSQGARSVVMMPVKKVVVTRGGSTPVTTLGASASIESTIDGYIKKIGASERVHKAALDVLREARV